MVDKVLKNERKAFKESENLREKEINELKEVVRNARDEINGILN